jgi:hypothetical protein
LLHIYFLSFCPLTHKFYFLSLRVWAVKRNNSFINSTRPFS